MKTKIFFYTGTGNSLWSAKLLAKKFGETELIPMKKAIRHPISIDTDIIGLVFPVHIWGLPRPVIDLIKKLKPRANQYYFALAINAGQVARSLIQLKELMQSQGMQLSAGFDICLPSNYIPWGGPGPQEKQQARFAQARQKINSIANIVLSRKPGPIEKGPLWQNLLFTLIYKLSFKHVPQMDKSFWVDEKCNACGICRRLCPADNIELQDGKPWWKNHCEQCLACIQWCPRQAIQYGKKTPGYERYHHPEIAVDDMLAIVSKS